MRAIVSESQEVLPEPSVFDAIRLRWLLQARQGSFNVALAFLRSILLFSSVSGLHCSAVLV